MNGGMAWQLLEDVVNLWLTWLSLLHPWCFPSPRALVRVPSRSLDTPPNAPHFVPTLPHTVLSRMTPPNPVNPEVRPTLGKIDTGGPSLPAGTSQDTFPQSRRASEPLDAVVDSSHRIIASSSTTGCYISAPISAPAHYPMPTSALPESQDPKSPTSSSSSSISSGSSRRGGSAKSLPPPPRWAQPPAKTNTVSGRASLFGGGTERPDIDFDPELFQSDTDEWIEIIKGSEGRIAVKSTKGFYIIMVWLPGFS
jgi:hypothetical protein